MIKRCRELIEVKEGTHIIDLVVGEWIGTRESGDEIKFTSLVKPLRRTERSILSFTHPFDWCTLREIWYVRERGRPGPCV